MVEDVKELVAERFRAHILAAGNTRDPAGAYRAFRTRHPDIAPLLRHRGFPVGHSSR
jgi:peptidyl-dipeptidase Dcp